MIWTSDAEGKCIYVCPEWTAVTGQPVSVAYGDGWTRVIHEDDVPLIAPIRNAAFRAKCLFTMHYRLRVAEGGYVWIIDGAAPTFVPPDDAFLGFIGRAVRAKNDQIQAGGRLGRYDPAPTHADTSVGGVLDQIADHLLIAHALLEEEPRAVAIAAPLRQAMWRVTLALAGVNEPAPELRH